MAVTGVIAKAVDALGEVRGKYVIQALESESISSDYLSDWLYRAGHPVSARSIRRARQKNREML